MATPVDALETESSVALPADTAAEAVAAGSLRGDGETESLTDGRTQPTRSSAHRSVSRRMIVANTPKRQSSTETQQEFLGRITHLNLGGKGLGGDRWQGDVGTCTQLKVLYLYDNAIEELGSVIRESKLTHLYIQNNALSTLNGLPISTLQKLFVDKNNIEMVEGLQDALRLTELHVASQRLADGQSLQFDPNTLQTLSGGLRVLDVSGNGLVSFAQFSMFERLEVFRGGKNAVANMDEILCITCLPSLREAEFKGNPVARRHYYRDQALAVAPDTIRLFDGEEVSSERRIVCRNLQLHRRRLQGESLPKQQPNDLPIVVQAPPRRRNPKRR